MSTIYYTATSLDGFLADDEDDISYLDAVPQPSEDTYTPFIANVGSICMGSATYDFLLRHIAKGNAWLYPKHPVWVFTTRKLPTPPQADVRFVQGDVAPVHAAMKAAAPGKDVWVCGGGGLAARFLEADLLDEMVITVASWTLGSGKPLLPFSSTRPFELVSARALGTGFAELRYRVPR
jgi:dihydrofolate reductase